MKKIFTLAAVAMASVSFSALAQDAVNDFIPKMDSMFFQELIESKGDADELISEVRIDVTFDEDVYWVGGFSGQCYLLDSNGEKYEGWHPDFGGLASDYTKMYFGVRGLDKYVDADYTLVIPEGLLGNTAWYYKAGSGERVNPELRYELNAWKLAGEPREDKTAYDFDPVYTSTSLEEVRISGHKQLELQLALDFSESVAINKNVQDKISVRDSEGNYLQEAVVRTFVSEENPNQVVVGLRGVDLKNSVDYTISIWEGAFGTLEWASEDYCEGHATAPMEYVVNPLNTSVGVGSVTVSTSDDAPVYNLQGIRVIAPELQKGVYIRDGKKFVVK